jgi:cation transport ATPase
VATYSHTVASSSANRVARPALVTLIAGLELAAAAWDGRCFLKLNAILPVSWGDLLSWSVLMPALMCILAIYAGVGLLQMRKNAWAIWMTRHIWLASLYALTIPALVAQSTYFPGMASVLLTWRLTIVVFSVMAGSYLYSLRQQFGENGAR